MTSSPAPTPAPTVADLIEQLSREMVGDTPEMRRLRRDSRELAADLRAAGSIEAQIDADRAHPFRKDTVPALPDCAGFTGTGQRCTACRVHRNMHAPTKETS